MDCPICDAPFLNYDVLSKHLEEHKSKSILNDTVDSSTPHKTKNKVFSTKLILNDFFGTTRFEEIALERIRHVDDPEKLVQRTNFIEQIKQIVSKHPFVYIPSFVDDFMHGVSSQTLLDTYYIQDTMRLKTLIQDRLHFKQDRYKKQQYDNAIEMNAKIPG